MLRFNLGQKKLNSRKAKGQAEIKRRIAESCRQVMNRRPQVVVVEDMSGLPAPVAQGVSLDAFGTEGEGRSFCPGWEVPALTP